MQLTYVAPYKCVSFTQRKRYIVSLMACFPFKEHVLKILTAKTNFSQGSQTLQQVLLYVEAKFLSDLSHLLRFATFTGICKNIK